MNRLRQILTSGEASLGTAIALPHPFALTQVVRAGFGWVFLDMQHGLMGYQDLPSLCATVRAGGATPLVRLPYEDYSGAQRALDAGAEGIIMPCVDTAAEAARAVAACRYPPLGIRSFGPYASPYGSDIGLANQEVLCFVMVESQAAVEQIDAIMATPGLDGVYIGPNDLAISLGLGPVLDVLYRPGAASGGPDLSALHDALTRIRRAGQEHHRFVGFQVADAEAAARALAEGYRLVGLGSDVGMLSMAATAQLTHVHQSQEGRH